MNRTNFHEAADISLYMLAKMGKDVTVIKDSLLKIYNALNCVIADISEVSRKICVINEINNMFYKIGIQRS